MDNPPISQKAPVALLVLCGLPGAGKSTLVSNLEVYIRDNVAARSNTTHVTRISFDDIEASFLNKGPQSVEVSQDPGFDSKLWKAAREQALQEVRGALQIATARAGGGLHGDSAGGAPLQTAGPCELVIVDDNMYYRSMRRQMFLMAREHQCAFLQMYLQIDIEEAKLRNSKREGLAKVPESTIDRMAALMEAPEAATHAWEAPSMTVHQTCHGATTPPCSAPPPPPATSPAATASTARPPSTSHPASTSPAPPHGNSPGDEADSEPKGIATDASVSSEAHSVTKLPQLWAALWSMWGAAPSLLPTEEELAARRAAGSAGNASSLMHQLDVRLRKMISSTMQGATDAYVQSSEGASPPKNLRTQWAQVLNVERRRVLDALRALSSSGSSGDSHSEVVAFEVALEQEESDFMMMCDRIISTATGAS